jgi:hypothetical protein
MSWMFSIQELLNLLKTIKEIYIRSSSSDLKNSEFGNFYCYKFGLDPSKILIFG